MTFTYACGCMLRGRDDWTLCADCSSRIGRFGTCLQCHSPADEQWTHPALNGEAYCSPGCANAAVVWVLHDAS